MLPANLLINSDSVHTDSSVSEENESGIVLPTHLSCACHTLSLVATTDAKKAMEDNPSRSHLNNTTTGKVLPCGIHQVYQRVPRRSLKC